MIHVKQKGDFSKATRYFEKVKNASRLKILHEYGRKGVAALKSATPVESGLTASSWYYEIVSDKGKSSLNFKNSNIQQGVSIAIILQYGHGTGTGGWVEGRDYINPAIRPIFDELANKAWREVTSV